MEDTTTTRQPVFCDKCGRNLSRATQVTYIDGLPICP